MVGKGEAGPQTGPQTVMVVDQDWWRRAARSAYIHVPFCRRRCFYCDFPIAVVGEFRPVRGGDPSGLPDPLAPKVPLSGENSGAIAQYVTLLGQEIETVAAQGRSRLPLETVFFGGGTPSLLSPDQLGFILDLLDRHWGLAAGAEVAIEMDPGTFDRPKLADFVAAGINRVSLGVQAFEDELLAACGRSHRCADVDRAVDAIAAVDLNNWSLDLIAGLPHQTVERWEWGLERAIALGPPHLSVYDLTVEPGTPFGKWYKAGCAPLPSDRATAEMYRRASEVLRGAGYHHYEISNYARSGFECHHNQVYWHNRPYYGFGMGAASHLDGVRFSRPRNRAAYGDWVAGGCAIAAEPTPETDRLLETLMLGMRLAAGLSIHQLRDRFGPGAIAAIETVLQPHRESGLVRFLDQRGTILDTAIGLGDSDRLALSDPEGFLLSNQVLSDLFEALS
ncbi:MAG: radical SAM family heme chaperone HemW [Cyanophyceae cyanobacterium]